MTRWQITPPDDAASKWTMGAEHRPYEESLAAKQEKFNESLVGILIVSAILAVLVIGINQMWPSIQSAWEAITARGNE